MLPEIQPFNIELLMLSDPDVKTLRQIKVLDIFDGFSRNFHPEGLFSVEIFGKVGEERRNRMYSYINLQIGIMHPVVFKALSDLKGLYKGILSGKTFAVFNPETNDFDQSDPITGDTGYAFFLEHFPKLQFEQRPSPKREFNIRLVDKYRQNLLMDKLVVMPAGLRDYTVDDNGKPSEDEINTLYRSALKIASVAEGVNIKSNEAYLDQTRYNLQLAVNKIYEYIISLLEGKSKLILGKWASRKIFDSTRNVFSPHISDSTKLFGPKSVSTQQTVMGMFQFLRATMPLAVNKIRETYLSSIFIGQSTPAKLINKKTLKQEAVLVDPDYFDSWMTYEGIEKQCARFEIESIRHDYVEIDGRYLALIYKDNAGYRVIHDIDEVPEGYDRKNVYPITLAEILYLSVFEGSSEIPCYTTRYPITGYGSVYPSYVYLKSTVRSLSLRRLNHDWEPTDVIANEFPIYQEKFYNTLSPALLHLGRLGADKQSRKDSI